MYSIAKERVCTKCGVNKPIEEFGWKDRTRGYRHWVCKECTAQRSSDWYYSNRDRQKENVKRNNQNYREQARLFVLNFLLKHPCTNCGESDPRVLEFHHEGDKENEVSRLMGRGASLEVLKSEMDKCKVLCANCHRKLTSDERGWYKGRWAPPERFERSTSMLRRHVLYPLRYGGQDDNYNLEEKTEPGWVLDNLILLLLCLHLITLRIRFLIDRNNDRLQSKIRHACVEIEREV